jgi:hypothetical protein
MNEHNLINNSQQLQGIIINSTSQDLGNRDCQNGFKMTTNQKKCNKSSQILDGKSKINRWRYGVQSEVETEKINSWEGD